MGIIAYYEYSQETYRTPEESNKQIYQKHHQNGNLGIAGERIDTFPNRFLYVSKIVLSLNVQPASDYNVYIIDENGETILSCRQQTNSTNGTYDFNFTTPVILSNSMSWSSSFDVVGAAISIFGEIKN